MFTKLAVFRALSSLYGLRIIKTLTIIAAVVFGVLLVGIWALAYFLSSWWWLLLIPCIVLIVAFIIIRFIARWVARGLYRQPLTSEQKQLLGSYIDKIERLLEGRQLSVPLVTLISVKDLLLYRELRTIKQLVSDSTSLKREFKVLERTFDASTTRQS